MISLVVNGFINGLLVTGGLAPWALVVYVDPRSCVLEDSDAPSFATDPRSCTSIPADASACTADPRSATPLY